MVMVIAVLVVFGLCLGSFVNALVWRVYEQDRELSKKKPNKKYLSQLSLSKGRSMCPSCKHELGAQDLVPVLSWLSTKGKCRYCHKSIRWQYPVVELSTAVLFVVSYIFWPSAVEGSQVVIFGLWLICLVGLMALLVYDVRWMLLPNRIMLPTAVVAALLAGVNIGVSAQPGKVGLQTLLAVAVGGGIFWILFQVSQGKWIGGGDVKLGWLLGLLLATPSKSMLMIFVAALGGTLLSVPLLASGKLRRNAVIPFGPFLIAGAIFVQLWGAAILDWYSKILRVS